MKAIVAEGGAGLAGVRYKDVPIPEPGPGQVRIQLRTAGLNRRDLRVIALAKTGNPPVILGSDGAGVVDALGSGVENLALGDEVIIHPALKWIRNTPAPPPDYEILGSPTDGTFAEYIVVDADHVAKKPDHLSFEEAGVLPLAALTAYRALFTRGELHQGQTVLLPGVGGGVATYLVQFAKARKARVVVTSRSADKRESALRLGADMAIDSTQDWLPQLNGERVDLVVDSVGAATFDQCFSVLKPGGTLVTFGATAGDEVRFDLRSFFYGQFNLKGSTMGSREEFDEMLRFVSEHRIHPVVDAMFPLAEAVSALTRLQDTRNFGKIGLIIG
nr:zinc-binding dehydrogenase [Alicyclobacillus contaminans]